MIKIEIKPEGKSMVKTVKIFGITVLKKIVTPKMLRDEEQYFTHL
jgi:hypothetical protein